METHSSILAWRIPWTEELADDSSWGKKESDTTEQLSMHTHTRARMYMGRERERDVGLF